MGSEGPEHDDDFSYNVLAHREGSRNDADLLTKGFYHAKHWSLCHRIGIRKLPLEEVERSLAKGKSRT